MNVQLVVAHGGGLSDADAAALPGRPIAVQYAPQMAVLAHARLTITHAGLNTVLDSLASGVPMVTIPLTYEQPAISRRVEAAGAGRTISIDAITPQRLGLTMADLLDRGEFRDSALTMKDAIVSAGGVRRGADVIEKVINL